MLPYNYTLGWQAHTTGMVMARPMWLEFPAAEEAYTHSSEYMWGDSLLVAPVTVAGTQATTDVWFPPGQWLAFTDAGLATQSFQGPATYPVETTLMGMPVFVKAGSIIPMQSYTDNAVQAPATFELRVVGGGDCQYTLYEDEGEGFGYQTGASATTLMTLAGSQLTIAARAGSYPQAPANRTYQISWSNISVPATVSVDGTVIPEAADDGGADDGVADDASAGDGGSADSWSFDASTQTLVVNLLPRDVTNSLTIQLQ